MEPPFVFVYKAYDSTEQRRLAKHEIIKGSIEPTHGSVCSGVRKLQSMNVLKLLSTN